MRTSICSALGVLWIAPAASAQPARSLAFTHVTVVDVVNGSLRSDVSVVVEGNRIIAVADSERALIPRGARVIDARGKFLIAGLWDMHVHAVWPPTRSQTLATHGRSPPSS